MSAEKAKCEALQAQYQELCKQRDEARSLCEHLMRFTLTSSGDGIGASVARPGTAVPGKRPVTSKAQKREPKEKKEKKQKERKPREKKQKEKKPAKERKQAAKPPALTPNPNPDNGTVLYSSTSSAPQSSYSAIFANKLEADAETTPTKPSNQFNGGKYWREEQNFVELTDDELEAERQEEVKATAAGMHFHTHENTPTHTPKHNDYNYWRTEHDDVELSDDLGDEKKASVGRPETPSSGKKKRKKKAKKAKKAKGEEASVASAIEKAAFAGVGRSSLSAESPAFKPMGAPEGNISPYHSPYHSPAIPVMPPPRIFLQQPLDELTDEDKQQVEFFSERGQKQAEKNRRSDAIDSYTAALNFTNDDGIYYKRAVLNRAEGKYLARSKFPALKDKGLFLIRRSVKDFNIVLERAAPNTVRHQASLMYRAEAFMNRALVDSAKADMEKYRESVLQYGQLVDAATVDSIALSTLEALPL